MQTLPTPNTISWIWSWAPISLRTAHRTSILRSQAQDTSLDLRYSLRSLCRYYPNHGPVLISTEHVLPEWLSRAAAANLLQIVRPKYPLDANAVERQEIARSTAFNSVTTDWAMRVDDDQVFLSNRALTELQGHGLSIEPINLSEWQDSRSWGAATDFQRLILATAFLTVLARGQDVPGSVVSNCASHCPQLMDVHEVRKMYATFGHHIHSETLYWSLQDRRLLSIDQVPDYRLPILNKAQAEALPQDFDTLLAMMKSKTVLCHSDEGVMACPSLYRALDQMFPQPCVYETA